MDNTTIPNMILVYTGMVGGRKETRSNIEVTLWISSLVATGSRAVAQSLDSVRATFCDSYSLVNHSGTFDKDAALLL